LHTIPLPVLTPGLDAASTEAAAAAAQLTSRDGGFFFHYPMMGVEYLIHGVHNVTGLPWWASIAAATIAGRVILFPLQASTATGFMLMNRREGGRGAACQHLFLPFY
jgi:membrane protein insertase Oxa1/YidC/SpoIIIJ